MARNSRSRTTFENMKYEIASQLGINLKQGYNGDITSHDAGRIGGNIVKKVFQSYTGNQYPVETSQAQQGSGMSK